MSTKYTSSNDKAGHAANVIDEVTRSRDDMGVISSDALHKQLSKLTPDDWRILSATYSKDEKNPDGFYITDENNKITIHNDMRKADRTAHEGLLKGAWDLTTESLAVPATFVFGSAWGAINGAIAGGLSDLVAPASMTLALGEDACAIAGTFAGPAIVAGGTAAYLYYESRHEKTVAQNDLLKPQTLNMQLT